MPVTRADQPGGRVLVTVSGSGIWPSGPATAPTVDEIRAGRRRHADHQAHRAKVRDVADCAACPKSGVGVHIPKRGDGSELVTYWHKRPDTGAWCRSSVEPDDVREVRR